MRKRRVATTNNTITEAKETQVIIRSKNNVVGE